MYKQELEFKYPVLYHLVFSGIPYDCKKCAFSRTAADGTICAMLDQRNTYTICKTSDWKNKAQKELLDLASRIGCEGL